MKKFAFFLPQFHEIPENNKWWGQGFTEWTNVRRAKPLFKGHKQPKHSLNNNYYDLLDKQTMLWQTELMNKSGLDGFIYYHYYFTGKLLLEKPAENLLKWKDIPQNFFFCWANHTWKRSWEGTSEVLLNQTYGEKKDWEKHFQYLLPFFRDSRYEKKNNEPLFMVFDPYFKEKNKMFAYFDMRCREEGFNGLCLIETYGGEDIKKFKQNKAESTEFTFYREPTVSQYAYIKKNFLRSVYHHLNKKMREKGYIHKPYIIDGNKMMDMKLNNEPLGKEIANGLWFEWDNTPRHKYRGYVITPYDYSKFAKYMELVKKQDYLFINAWNEWAEGMMIEPTVENGYKYIEWLEKLNNK
ncbi:glycoside hydrolase family 99-like domain-containing protein [Lactobacillus sp. PV012]|uniref:glycosyltransferase WbsX family protein n=1 Tax=Lactobacillus sp. PV012 TaxID=2594494 RepID=UPI00223E9C35|nr:glycoside hydrolase family 99-like domain-containing protein [Lactobacillus sp. PV012]QNQ82766.1 polysaccharide biosynthesis protein [Lactobacillus sp. PV012]